jgi:L-serine/L-threonine ammonia-lyase
LKKLEKETLNVFKYLLKSQQMNVAVRLVVPPSTSLYMIEKMNSLDVEVEIYGETWNEDNEYALQLVAEHKLPSLPPFDHPLLWKGHCTPIDECDLQIDRPNKIVCGRGRRWFSLWYF